MVVHVFMEVVRRRRMPVQLVRKIDIFINKVKHIYIINEKWKKCNRIVKKLQLKIVKLWCIILIV